MKNDVEDFNRVMRAMEVLGFKAVEQESLFRVLGAIVHLGNVSFDSEMKDNMETTNIATRQELNFASGLLGVNPEQLQENLTNKTQLTRGEKIISPLTLDQSLDTRDALSKSLYSAMFQWMVGKLNSIVDKQAKVNSIGILDIFGFEDFKTNSFEQLCINFANENLQFYFNQVRNSFNYSCPLYINICTPRCTTCKHLRRRSVWL